MKSSKNICLVITLLLVVFILAGCGLIPSTTQPKGGISGRVLIPLNAVEVSKDITGWVPVAGAEVTIVDASGVTHTVMTDENGYYSFGNIAVNPNTVITATATIDGNKMVLKSVITQAVAADQDYNAEEMSPESTALALVVEQLLDAGMNPGDIDPDEIINSDSFPDLLEQVTTAIEEGNDATEDTYVTDLVNEAVNEIVNPPSQPSSPSTDPTPSPVTINSIVIDGNAVFDETLTATPSPEEATADYQWKSSDTIDGTYVDISGAISNTYTLTAAEIGKWIKAEATGNSGYAGTVISDPAGPVEKAEAVSVPSAPTAFEVTDTSIQLNYISEAEFRRDSESWQPGTSFYSLTPDTSYTFYARYMETDTHLASDPSTGTVIQTKIPLSSIGVITGDANAGQVLTAGVLTPAGATAAYQWQASDAEDGTYADISGATSNTYTLTAAELDKWIKVTATGTGDYYGSATSAAVGPVKVGVITLDVILGVTKPVTGATPVSTITETAQYTGTVAWSPAHNPFQGETVYTATISLTPKTGYTLTDVSADFFTVSGATTVTNSANSGEVIAEFPKTVYSLGDTGPAGGVIFYINPNYATDGWRYLEVAPANTEWTGIEWGAYNIDVLGTQTGIGTGKNNTDLIVAALNEIPETNKAAQLCAALTVVNNSITYDDWFLPSKDELWEILSQGYLRSQAGFNFVDNWWTSSQASPLTAWVEGYTVSGLSGWTSLALTKTGLYDVRAIRSF